jgi:hypothetical protein
MKDREKREYPSSSYFLERAYATTFWMKVIGPENI